MGSHNVFSESPTHSKPLGRDSPALDHLKWGAPWRNSPRPLVFYDSKSSTMKTKLSYLAPSLGWNMYHVNHIRNSFWLQLPSRMRKCLLPSLTSCKVNWVYSWPEGTCPFIPMQIWPLLNGTILNNFNLSSRTNIDYNIKNFNVLLFSKL